MYFIDNGPTPFSNALWLINRQKIIDLFLKKYPKRDRDVMTGLARNNNTPIEIVEFIANRPDLVFQWGEFYEKVQDSLKYKKRNAMRYGKRLLLENFEELPYYDQSLVYDYLYLTGQRESCIKVDPKAEPLKDFNEPSPEITVNPVILSGFMAACLFALMVLFALSPMNVQIP
jgi:hypothetical protein